MSTLSLAITLIFITEFLYDAPFRAIRLIFPLFLLTDRLLIESISVSFAFSVQVGLFFIAFQQLLVPSPSGLPTLFSFILTAFAAAQRLEFCVVFLPVSFYALFGSKKWQFALIGCAAAVVVLAAVDRSFGSPSLCLNMTARLRIGTFLRTDTNGLEWAAALVSLLAIFADMDGRLPLAIGMATAVVAVLTFPAGSANDRDISGVVVARLLGYAWTGIIVARQRTIGRCVAVAGIALGIAIARAARAIGWIPSSALRPL
jgi:hypothetical protein